MTRTSQCYFNTVRRTVLAQLYGVANLHEENLRGELSLKHNVTVQEEILPWTKELLTITARILTGTFYLDLVAVVHKGKNNNGKDFNLRL